MYIVYLGLKIDFPKDRFIGKRCYALCTSERNHNTLLAFWPNVILTTKRCSSEYTLLSRAVLEAEKNTCLHALFTQEDDVVILQLLYGIHWSRVGLSTKWRKAVHVCMLCLLLLPSWHFIKIPSQEGLQCKKREEEEFSRTYFLLWYNITEHNIHRICQDDQWISDAAATYPKYFWQATLPSPSLVFL